MAPRWTANWPTKGQELRKIGEFFSAQAAETGVAFSVRIASEVQARVNRELFECAIGNLLANSLAHTPAGGQQNAPGLKRSTAGSASPLRTPAAALPPSTCRTSSTA